MRLKAVSDLFYSVYIAFVVFKRSLSEAAERFKKRLFMMMIIMIIVIILNAHLSESQ